MIRALETFLAQSRLSFEIPQKNSPPPPPPPPHHLLIIIINWQDLSLLEHTTTNEVTTESLSPQTNDRESGESIPDQPLAISLTPDTVVDQVETRATHGIVLEVETEICISEANKEAVVEPAVESINDVVGESGIVVETPTEFVERNQESEDVLELPVHSDDFGDTIIETPTDESKSSISPELLGMFHQIFRTRSVTHPLQTKIIKNHTKSENTQTNRLHFSLSSPAHSPLHPSLSLSHTHTALKSKSKRFKTHSTPN